MLDEEADGSSGLAEAEAAVREDLPLALLFLALSPLPALLRVTGSGDISLLFIVAGSSKNSLRTICKEVILLLLSKLL